MRTLLCFLGFHANLTMDALARAGFHQPRQRVKCSHCETRFTREATP